MDPTSQALRKETEKWLAKLQKERPLVKVISPSPNVKACLKNLDAYMKDTSHFLEKEDFIRAFEAVVYAWGILETLESMHLIEVRRDGISGFQESTHS